MFIVSESGNPSNYIQVKPLGLPVDPFVVDFYRSREQADGKYGKGDKSYDGAFGFDRFEKDVVAEGRINEYPKLAGIVQKDKNTSGNRDYLCPYLSIWPPNVQGNMNNTKNTVEVVVRLEKGKGFKGKCGKQGTAKFISSDPSSITIDGGPDKSLTLNLKTKESQLPTIKLECLKPFSSEVYITAEISDKVVGKLIIYPNDKRYKVIIQPVHVSLGTSKRFNSVPTASVPDIREAQFKDYLNNKSFNQALIHCEVASTTHQITLLHSDFFNKYFFNVSGNNYLSGDDKIRFRFNSLMQKDYIKLSRTPQETHEIATKQSAYTQSGMDQAIDDFMTEFTRLVSYDTQAQTPLDQVRAAQTAHTHQSFTQAWNNPLINNGTNGKYDVFLKAQQQMHAILAQQGVINVDEKTPRDKLNSDPQNIQVYVFYHADIHASFADDIGRDLTQGKVNGYTYTGNGITHMFSNGFSSVDEIIHEIGHGLGLPHTFSKGLGDGKVVAERTRQEIDEEAKNIKGEIKYLEGRLDDFENRNHNLQTLNMDLDKYLRYHNLYWKYKSRLDPVGSLGYNKYRMFQYRINEIQDMMCLEGEVNLSSLDVSNTDLEVERSKNSVRAGELEAKKTELSQLEAEREKASKKGYKAKYKPQSGTDENYMDYAMDEKNTVNSRFQRKCLYKSQWDVMRDHASNVKLIKLMP
ncbi:hypothetical protein AAG747_07940 [Rapidithrix thailandica]|uniref:Uncharacterized protein n=1 Tax=Rapidithrix thailandica TaxID=413964 RepID=A0AAW9S7X1_9BACT